MAQIPGATNQMSLTDLEEIFFTSPNAYLKDSSWTADELGLIGWTYDPVMSNTGAAVTAGLLYLNRIKLRLSASITGVALAVQAAGVTLTAGQNFIGLWRATDRTLIGVTADQTVNWGGTGYKTANLVGGPFQVPAGDYYVGLWSNGATPPGFFRGTNNGANLNNAQLSAPNLRMCTADAGLTTTAPSPFGAQSASANPPWFGLF